MPVGLPSHALTEETRGFIDRSLLERMPEGGYLVNTARGLVAMDDLLWALEEGPLAGAALDVFPQEPPPPLIKHSERYPDPARRILLR